MAGGLTYPTSDRERMTAVGRPPAATSFARRRSSPARRVVRAFLTAPFTLPERGPTRRSQSHQLDERVETHNPKKHEHSRAAHDQRN